MSLSRPFLKNPSDLPDQIENGYAKVVRVVESLVSVFPALPDSEHRCRILRSCGRQFRSNLPATHFDDAHRNRHRTLHRLLDPIRDAGQDGNGAVNRDGNIHLVLVLAQVNQFEFPVQRISNKQNYDADGRRKLSGNSLPKP